METGIVWVAKNSEKLVFPKIVILGGSVSSPTGHFPPTFWGGGYQKLFGKSIFRKSACWAVSGDEKKYVFS